MSRKRRHRDVSPPRLWSWDEKLGALRVYRDRFGTCEVAPTYTVPCGNSDWPSAMGGMDLAHAVESFRTAPTLPPSTLDVLIEMGFPWRPGGGASPCVTHVKRRGGYLRVVAFDDQIDALDMYRHLYGRRAIAPMFLVPHKHANWPRAMWDVELARVPEMLAKHAVELSDKQLTRLHSLMFLRQIPPWPALTQLLTECDRDVPIDFVVPYGCRHAGTPLGDLAWQLHRRQPQLARHRQAWLTTAHVSTSFDRIDEALRHYHEAHPAEPLPSTIIVRRRGWPPALRGLRLGYWTMRLLAMHRALVLDASILAALSPFLTSPPRDLSGVGSDIDLTISDLDDDQSATQSDGEFSMGPATRRPQAVTSYADNEALRSDDDADEIATSCLLSPAESPVPVRSPDDTETCSEDDMDMGLAFDADETEDDEAPTPAPTVLPSHPLPSTSVVAAEKHVSLSTPSLVDQPWWAKQRRPPLPLALRPKSLSTPTAATKTLATGTDPCPEPWPRSACKPSVSTATDARAPVPRVVVPWTVAWSKEYEIEELGIDPSLKVGQQGNSIPPATPSHAGRQPLLRAQVATCTPLAAKILSVASPSQLQATVKDEAPAQMLAFPPSTTASVNASAGIVLRQHEPALATQHDRLVPEHTSGKPVGPWAPKSEPSTPQPSLVGEVLASAVVAPATATDDATIKRDVPSDELRMYSKWDRRLMALQVYHQLHGHVLVPSDFVVPSGDATWPPAFAGFTLGAAVETIRAASDRLQPVHRYRLDVIGFVWDASVAALWRDVLHALKRWTRRRTGRQITDVDIVDAPASLSGGPIGRYLTRLDVDAVLSSPAYAAPLLRLQYDVGARWRAKLLALQTYQERFNHLHVPASFRVPSCPRWDASLWDLPLGLIVMWLRDIGAAAMAPEKATALHDLGFEWASVDFELLADAARLVPASSVPPSLVLPSSPHVPDELRGYPLGLVVAKRRAYMERMTLAYHASVSLLVGRPADPRPDEVVFDMSLILSTLMQYASFHGSTAVPLLFTLPADSDVWLDGAREMPLGFFVAFLHDSFDELDELVQSLLQDHAFPRPDSHVVRSGSVKVEADVFSTNTFAVDVKPAY